MADETHEQHETATDQLNRRSLLKSAAFGLCVAGLSKSKAESAEPVLRSSKPDNKITRENAHQGTTDWQLTFVRTDRAENRRSKLIEGYCSEQRVRPGETIDFFVNASEKTDVTIDLYRMGYYQGTGGRWRKQLGPVTVSPQPDPEIGPNRIRECEWNKTASLTIPDDWTSGVYLGKLSCNAHRYQSYVVFIVRDDEPADIIMQCSDNTWQAYNKWPHEFSLYNSDPPNNSLNGTTRVSFNRPYAWYPQVVDQPLSLGSGEFLLWEFPLAFWLEQQGYDITYCSNLDLHTDPASLKRAPVFLSVGHDEYYSLEMHQNLKQAIADGLNVGFLSGNTSCFVAPMTESSQSQPNRTFYRAGRYGGLIEAEKEMGFGPFDMEGPNENLLIGARTIDPFNGSGDWICSQPDHWLFADTGMKAGDGIPGLVGWEFHGDPAAIPGLEVIAAGTSTNAGGRDANWTSTLYSGPKDNLVFNASTIYWSMGLSDPPGFTLPFSHFGRPHGPDRRVQQITTNFLKKCGIV
ncbi:hypothetical protein Pla110_06010 [Polystyrenella longa]|uniref:N,N-dimethylformamidase beta subunit-like C-terminal domain-containing protein n=1 Tax=Polystyrenella longa TaxID=2528007 RepID=A0A518CI70_9PLAN|nr:N,N-dimethylformamidase beta subunit family domain-containing protein [Polystyrenella longa]QDU78897.1 hypothetical protein Pla110_06010 [Polystyrenella longa]